MCLDGPSRRIISEPIELPTVLPVLPSGPEPRPAPHEVEHQAEPEPAAPS